MNLERKIRIYKFRGEVFRLRGYVEDKVMNGMEKLRKWMGVLKEGNCCVCMVLD